MCVCVNTSISYARYRRKSILFGLLERTRYSCLVRFLMMSGMEIGEDVMDVMFVMGVMGVMCAMCDVVRDVCVICDM